MKKIINKIGGENRLKSMAAALWLVRENYESGSRTTSQMEAKYKKLMETLILHDIVTSTIQNSFDAMFVLR